MISEKVKTRDGDEVIGKERKQRTQRRKSEDSRERATDEMDD